MTWTRTCYEGRAQGEGTLKWVWEGGNQTLEETGSLTDGKPHGQWVRRHVNGNVGEVLYVEGEKLQPVGHSRTGRGHSVCDL